MKVPIVILDKPNKNNRIYPREVMEKALRKYQADFIDENRAMVVKRLPETSAVSLLDCVGVVKEYTIEGDTVFVDIEFLPQVPEGLICETAVREQKLSVRTHGMGSMRKQDDGTYIISDDYEFISCFLTNEPA